MIIDNITIKITESFDVSYLAYLMNDIITDIVDNEITSNNISLNNELIGSWVIKD
jgi:hypothetical protein